MNMTDTEFNAVSFYLFTLPSGTIIYIAEILTFIIIVQISKTLHTQNVIFIDSVIEIVMS